MLTLIGQIILILGTLAGGITDAKTGYIYDWITIPLILIGLILSIIQQQWFNVTSGITIFLLLFIMYKLGKIGGGDVKLFSAIALLNPFNQINFLISVFLVAAISSMLFYSVFYSLKYIRKNGFKKIEKKDLIMGVASIIFLIIYFSFLILNNLVSELFIIFLGTPLLCASIFLIFQKGINKSFFEQKLKLNQLDEDEIISLNNSKKILTLLNNKQLIEKKEIELLKRNKIKEIIVMRNLPKFGPFIFIGTLIGIYIPNLIFILI